jgi:hypothetical protein
MSAAALTHLKQVEAESKAIFSTLRDPQIAGLLIADAREAQAKRDDEVV